MSEQSDYKSHDSNELAAQRPATESQPEKLGGLGEGQTHRRSDARMIGRSLRESWNVPPEARDKLPTRLVAIAIDPTAKRREQIAATKVLVQMHTANQHAEEVLMKHERLDEGLPTERIELKPITLRVAERINPNPSDSPPSPSDNGASPSDNGADR